MHKQCYLMLLLALCLACHHAENKEATQPDVQVKAAVQEVDPLTAKMTMLQTLPAADLTQLGNLLPKTWEGRSRSNFTLSSNMGYAMAQADYPQGKTAALHVALYDCAGAAGADLYRSNFAQALQNAKNGGPAKAVAFNGAEAIEKTDESTGITTMIYMADERTMAVISGKKLGAGDWQKAAAAIKR